MFGFLEYPPLGYRYPYGYGYAPLICRRSSPFDSYVRSVQTQLARILYDGLLELYDAPEPEEAQPEAEAEGKDEHKEQEEQEEKDPVRQVFFSSVRTSRTSGRRGDSERIEEHRERITQPDGSVHTVTRRQIGDRWYVHESHTAKDGESTSKETWHNVPEEAIQSFKDEWQQKHALTDQHQDQRGQQGQQSAIQGDAKPESE